MTVAIRFLLSLLLCLALPVHAQDMLLAKTECPGSAASLTTKAMATPHACPTSSDNGHHKSTGGACEAAATCGSTLAAFHPDFTFADSQYRRLNYPHVASHFLLQDFPWTLLRPPSLG